MTLAISKPAPSQTPIFDELIAQFLVHPVEARSFPTASETEVIAAQTLPLDCRSLPAVVNAEIVDVQDYSPSDKSTSSADGMEIGFWVLAIGALIGTIVWLWNTLLTPVIA